MKKGADRNELVCEIFETVEEGFARYGIRVCWRGETAEAADITTKREEALALLRLLRRGNVTPIALRDVVEDWLER